MCTAAVVSDIRLQELGQWGEGVGVRCLGTNANGYSLIF